MIVCALLIWVGAQLSAPWWYYALLGLMAFGRIVDLGIKIGKVAKE